jgi:hypothetical protein
LSGAPVPETVQDVLTPALVQAGGFRDGGSSCSVYVAVADAEPVNFAEQATAFTTVPVAAIAIAVWPPAGPEVPPTTFAAVPALQVPSAPPQAGAMPFVV